MTIRSEAPRPVVGAHDINVLYAEHAHGLRRIAMAEGLNAAAADDLVQRTFERFISSRSRVDLDRPMGPYFSTIARNLLRNDRRNAGLRRRDRPQLTEVEVARRQRQPTDYELDASALLARVERWLRELPPKKRRAVVRTRLLGQPYAEVAADLGTTPTALRQAVRRSVKDLCLELGYDPDDEDCLEGPCPWCQG